MMDKKVNQDLLALDIFLRRLIALPRNLWRLYRLERFQEGDIYLDCSDHAVVATDVGLFAASRLGPWDRDLAGISLVDGSGPRSCSVKHCAPKKLDYDEAMNYLALFEERRKAAAQIYAVYEGSEELQRVWRR